MIAFLNPSLQILALAAGLAGQPEALNSDRQLFLDDHLLDLQQTHDVTRTLNPPQDVQRILKPDQPWEKLGFIFYCCVVDDNGTAKLYHGSYDAEKKKHFMLATSTDGLHWERPKLGLKAFEGSKDNNLLAMDVIEAGIFLDAHSPPAERYRMVYTKGWPDPVRAGVYAASSADGIHWNPGETRMLPFVPDSQPSAVWDEERGEYAIYLRDWAKVLGPKPIRTIARVAAKDWHTPWAYDASVPPYLVWGKDKVPTPSKELNVVIAPDAQDPENLQFYTSGVVKYPYAPHVYLAFPATFLLFKGDDFKARAVTTNDGPFDTQFAASRDGITWQRWREAYVGAGLHGDLDLRLVSTGLGMIRRGPWLYQYFVGWPHTHGQPEVWEKSPESRAAWMSRDLGGLYCTRQRVDGFVSMNAGNTPAVITTQPFTFKGGRLHLNVHTDGIGSVKAALLDAEGKELPGFETSACEAINADAIDYEVRWSGGTDVSAAQGKPVRLRLTLRHARLYAFQFTEPLFIFSMSNPTLPHSDLLQLKRWNTPTIYNGWEQITQRDIAAEGFNLEETRDFMPQMGPMVGYAVTVVIEPSKSKHREANPNGWSDYRHYVASVPGPKIVIVQDLDKPAVIGAFWGEVNSNIHRALGCVGTIIDGAIRDVDEMTNAGFKALARRMCVGHAFSHPVRWNCEVEVFGRTVKPGDLIHADKHGFLVVPPEDQPRLLEAARFMDSNECNTLIPAARNTLGKSVSEICDSIDAAGAAFGVAAKAKFQRGGEW